MKGPTRGSRVTRVLPVCLLLLVTPLLPAGTASAHARLRTTSTTAASPTTTTTLGLPVPTAPLGAPDNCVKKAWPAAVQSRPGAYEALGDGAYLWLDQDGAWALRVTHTKARDRAIYSGILTLAKGRFIDVKGLGNAGSDIVAEGPGGRTIVFRFVNFAQLDGLDFSTHCATSLKVNLRMSGSPLASTAVHLGAGEVNPPGNPFRLQRSPGGTIAASMSQKRALVSTTTTAVPA